MKAVSEKKRYFIQKRGGKRKTSKADRRTESNLVKWIEQNEKL